MLVYARRYSKVFPNNFGYVHSDIYNNIIFKSQLLFVDNIKLCKRCILVKKNGAILHNVYYKSCCVESENFPLRCGFLKIYILFTLARYVTVLSYDVNGERIRGLTIKCNYYCFENSINFKTS